MKCLSLFSGIGGFDLALRNLGHEIVGACEIDKYARQVYGKHFPRVRIYEDATKMQPSELPDFDILCAGFPCQAFSVAGKQLGFEDTRGTLFYEIARIAKEKRPRYLFLENVRGLLSHDGGRTITTIIQTFDELGYDIEWQVINSKYFVPQNRERIFIIGHLRGESTRKIFPLREDGKLSADTEKGSSTNVKCLTAGGHSGGLHSQMTILHHIKSDSQAKRVYKPEGISPSLGTGHAMQSPNILAWSKSTRKWGVESRIKVGEANTLSCGDGCRNQSTASYVTEKDRIRRLTPLECERLQGFPDGWTEGISDTQRYKCCGNAVTVPVVEYIAKHFT